MDATPQPETIGQITGIIAFASAVLWLLRWRIVREDKREEVAVAERSRREERQTVAAEQQAKATAENATALTQLAGAIAHLNQDVRGSLSELGERVEGLGVVIEQLREDLTPVQRPPIQRSAGSYGPGKPGQGGR